ncbi:type II secretion system F family protein [Arthrobacter sp. NPDC055585]
MTGFWIAGLLGFAWLLLVAGRGHVMPSNGNGFRSSDGTDRILPPAKKSAVRRSRFSEDELHRLPLLVHQLAGLLAAGRTPGQLWADASKLNRDAAGAVARDLLSTPLDRAARAAALGLSPVPVLQQAASSSSGLPAMFWGDLAACVQASERSGAPLAEILGRYAQGLEAVLDSRAARASALSGPKATVRLLTWLPLTGLGLGFLLGANPLAVLAQSPVGWVAAGTGTALGLAARLWSRHLISRAVPEEEGTG